MHLKKVRALASVLLLSAALSLASEPASRNRIRKPVDRTRTVTLTGNTNRFAQPLYDQGRVERDLPLANLTLLLRPSAGQQAELDALLAAQQDPDSGLYQQWLTPEEYADRFALSEDDLARVAAWLEGEGFTVTHLARTRNWIAFSGTAAQAERAFATEIRRYQVDGAAHYANATEPSIPEALEGLVAGIRGLDDFLPRAPRGALEARYTTGAGAHYLAPDDLATIYNLKALYNQKYDGAGHKLAVVGQSAIDLATVRNFRTQFGLAANDPVVKLVPGKTDPGVVDGDVVEAYLDLEWAGAVARAATIHYVYAPNVFDAVQYVVSQKLAPVVSMSYGACETGNRLAALQIQALAQQANSLGITWVNASGDSGAADCDYGVATATQGLAVDIPASVPEVTGVGGTTFVEGTGTYWSATNNAAKGSALSYIPEAAWNDTALAGRLSSTGGGASAIFAKPSWQTGTGVPSANARFVPDVAMPAASSHDGAIVCSTGACAGSLNGAMIVGGTSLAAPIFAGVLTLLNQYQVSTGAATTAGLGNINPTLYRLAANAKDAFHDITSGDNIVPCQNGSPNCTNGKLGYTATTGYDPVTGLGSVNAYSFVTAWKLAKPAPAALSTVAITPAQVTSGASATLTVTLTAAAPTGGATVTLAGNNATAFPVPASIAIPAGQSTGSVQVKAGTVTAAAQVTVTATYSGVSTKATVTVAPPPVTVKSLTLNATQITSATTANLTLTLTAAAPTGGLAVTLASSNATALSLPATVTVAAGQTSATAQAKAGTVTASTAVTVTATLNGASSTATATVLPVPLPTVKTVVFTGAQVNSGATATATITLSGAAPTGSAVVKLASSNGTALPAPATATVAAGQSSVAVSITAGSVASSTAVKLTATYNATSASAQVTIAPAPLPTVKSLAAASAQVSAGATTTATITLSAAAPSGGVVVSFTSSNATALPAPANITIPAGQTSATVQVKTGNVTAAAAVKLTATYNGTSAVTTITVAPVPPPTVKTLTASAATVSAGTAASLTVTLSGPAPAGGAAIALSSSNTTAFPAPATIPVPAGQSSVTVPVTAGTVTASAAVTVTAKYNGTTASATLTVTPPALPAIKAVAFGSAAVTGPAVITLTVTMSGPAPSGGAIMTVTSSNPAVIAVPAKVIMPAGGTKGMMSLLVFPVDEPTDVTLTFSYNNTSQSATLTVTP